MANTWEVVGKRLGLSRLNIGGYPYIYFGNLSDNHITLDGEFTMKDMEKIVAAWKENPDLLIVCDCEGA